MTTNDNQNPAGTPEAEVEINCSLVRDLLTEQHPDLADEAILPAANGWDNKMFRLGEELAVRLPRRRVAARLIEHEQRWLPEIARRVPVAVPTPVRVGRPGSGFPWKWSVIPWVQGTSTDQQPLGEDQAAAFGSFLRQLHLPAPPTAPANPYRGVALAERDATLQGRLQRLAQRHLGVDWDAVGRAWKEGLEASKSSRTVWIHGDLHPRNVIGRGGALAAVIDWGDLTSGDRTTDLAAAWMHFPNQAHLAFWSAYGEPSPNLVVRARAWAVFFGVVLLETGLIDDEIFARVGKQTLERATAYR